ncbi:MAG: restriction endonuclease subunit S [Bacteroidales bacterium]|nr:restriction endonuclease subunit S [Bacteroidales bacterium]
MSEVFEIRNGYTPSKSVKDFWENGTIPWFRMEDIRQNGRILSDSIQHITEKAIKGSGLFPANSIILATTATIGEHALIIADSLANQQFTNLKIRKSLSNTLDMKFFFHYMFIVDEWCKNNTNVSGFASVDMSKFKNLLIPIPPMDEQQRIVSILDRFETLVNDLSQGLPAEIEAVQEQYEYYRNKLLSFPKYKLSA